jgi:DNA-binding beta-propeller fold protein YncE
MFVHSPQPRGRVSFFLNSVLAPLLLTSITFLAGCSSSSNPDQNVQQGPGFDSYGTVTLWAGEPGRAAWDGDNNDLLASFLYFPADLTFTASGCYILDWNNHRIRRVTPQNTMVTAIGTDLLGDGDPNLLDRVQPVPATTIDLNHPTDVMELPNGNLLLSCWHNHKIREYDPITGEAWVIIGADAGFGGDGFDARDARLDFPTQTVRASDGSLYILDQRNARIRKVDPSFIITTVCGTGVQGYNGDGIDPKTAQLNFPRGNNPWISGALALDAQDRLYISDGDNHRIRRIDFAQNPVTIETVAGNGLAGYSGDAGDATAASLNYPRDIEIGPDGRLYIADENNHRIRAVDLTTGIIKTVAGIGVEGYSGEGGAATLAKFNRCGALAFDTNGDMYIADTFNHVIRKVTR